MIELFWTPEAIQDRDEIYDHIEADNPVAALAPTLRKKLW
jgi:toxin ParE1/3/4